MSTMTSERTAFETWLEGTTGWKRCAERGQPFSLRQTVNGDYCDYRVNGRWYAWKAHARLAQPAQAMDLGAIREIVQALRNNADDVEKFHKLTNLAHNLRRCADTLTRALSGEKAGPAGDEADAQWTANVEIPTVARLYYTGIGSRRYKRASVQSGAGEPLCFVSTARELLRRQRAALLPSSPAPDKEGEA